MVNLLFVKLRKQIINGLKFLTSCLQTQMYVFLTFCSVPPVADITADLHVSLSRLSFEFLHSCCLSLLPSENSNSKLSFLLSLLIVVAFAFISRLMSLPPLFMVGSCNSCLLGTCQPRWFLWLSALVPNGKEFLLFRAAHFDMAKPIMTPRTKAAMMKSTTIEALDVCICGS